MKTKFLLIAFVLVLMSCNQNQLFDQFNSDFTDNRWEASDVKSFEFENKQSEGISELKLHLGHIRGFQFKEVPLEVEITSPDGNVEKLPVILKLMDESGNDLGDCSGDICDVYQTIKTFEKLEKGKYKVAVKSTFAGPFLPNVLGVGIVVEKQK